MNTHLEGNYLLFPFLIYKYYMIQYPFYSSILCYSCEVNYQVSIFWYYSSIME